MNQKFQQHGFLHYSQHLHTQKKFGHLLKPGSGSAQKGPDPDLQHGSHGYFGTKNKSKLDNKKYFFSAHLLP
jgi:hypothetical protein